MSRKKGKKNPIAYTHIYFYSEKKQATATTTQKEFKSGVEIVGGSGRREEEKKVK